MKRSKITTKLVPPNPKSCQRLILVGCHPTGLNFMAFGPGSFRDCGKLPSVIVTEKVPNPEYVLCGSMSLCAACFVEFCETGKIGDVTVQKINK